MALHSIAMGLHSIAMGLIPRSLLRLKIILRSENLWFSGRSHLSDTPQLAAGSFHLHHL